MEAVQPFSPSKSYATRNFKKNIYRTFSSTPCENLAPINYHQNGILQTPPPPFLHHSFPPFLAHQRQPPLLPLPIPNNVVQNYNHVNTLSLNRGYSCPPINKKVNKNKKSKSTKSSPKKEESSKTSKVVMNVSSTNPLGPDPKDLPKDVSMVLSPSRGKSEQPDALSSRYMQSPKKDRTTLSLLYADMFKGNDNINKFSGSEVFTISPPPSSLPLPTFSLRPKLSCNVEAAVGVDTGATDDLRRLLRLR